MKQNNKKALYESIMASVAREVKKALNERARNYEDATVYTCGFLHGDSDTIRYDEDGNIIEPLRVFLSVNLNNLFETVFIFYNNDIDVWASKISAKGHTDYNRYISGYRETAKKMMALQPGETVMSKNVCILCVR